MKVVATHQTDWQCLKEVRLKSLKDSPDSFALSFEKAQKLTISQWQSLASGQSGVQFLIAYENDKPVGLIGGVCINDEYELVSMWVTPSVRRLNVGAQLIQALLSHALLNQHSSVVLNVSADNIAACRLYEKSGFVYVNEPNTINKSLQKMVWHPLKSDC